MSTQTVAFHFDSCPEFVQKVEGLLKEGVKPADITTRTPFHVHELDRLLPGQESRLRFFTLAGALAGFFLSLALMIYATLDWPLITGGKPLLSLPTLIIIAFECTILLGGIVSFLGFLYLGRLPDIGQIKEPDEMGNRFVIIVRGGK